LCRSLCTPEGLCEALTFKLSAVFTLARQFPISPECEENAAKCHEKGQANCNIPEHVETLAKRRSFEVATSDSPPNFASFLCEMKGSAARVQRRR
jgi:hypothetical protein